MMRARGLAASSIMAALVSVATIFIIVPIPATQGYFNVGDAMVMVARPHLRPHRRGGCWGDRLIAR
jgi:uncharacterized membrane protein